MTLVQHFTDDSFQKVLDNDKPMLVEFWAPWCGPCKQLAPTLDKISEEWKERLDVAKIDIDDNPDIASRYGITSIPAMLLFKNGEVVSTSIGAKPKAVIEASFTPYL